MQQNAPPTRMLMSVVLAVIALRVASAGEPVRVTLDLYATPLPAALTQLQAASGLRLAFADDLVKSAEPVTLAAKDEPVDDVLRAILRPRGLECVYTGETMAAIVPADSDVGMAKAAGRALRTFARLAKKLEGAVQVVDEVKVPEWTDEDDRGMAEGTVDLFSAVFFAQGRHPAYEENGYPLLDMLGRYDPDVRAGCAIAAVEAVSTLGGPRSSLQSEEDRPRAFPKDERAGIIKALDGTLGDPDPVARAMGLLLRAGLVGANLKGWRATAAPVLTAVKDPAPEVRFAAAFVCSPNGLPGGESIFEALRNDESAAVRMMAWIRAIQGVEWLPNPSSQLAGLLKDRNPVVKAFGLVAASLVMEREPRLLRALFPPRELDRDPYLKAAFDLYVPLLEHRRSRDQAQAKSRTDKSTFEEPVQGAAAFGTIVRMLASGKRSQQAIAAGTMPYGFWAGSQVGARLDLLASAISYPLVAIGAPYEVPEPRPSPAPVAKLCDSPSLFSRVLGIMACGALDTPDGWARVLAAMRSADEFDRLAGILACMMHQSADPAPLPGEVRAALIAAMRAPVFAERALAATAVASALPFDDALAVFQDQSRRDAGSPCAAMFLTVLLRRDELWVGDHDLMPQRRLAVLDAVLETKDPGLHVFFGRRMSWALEYQKPLLLTLICESDPDAFLALPADGCIVCYLWQEDFAVRAAADRFASLCEGNDPARLAKVARAFATYARESSLFHRGRDTRDRLLTVAERMLDGCLKEGAPDSMVSAGMELLGSLCVNHVPFEDEERWRAAPPGIGRAVLATLRRAGDRRHTSAVAGILRSLYSSRLLGTQPDRAIADAADSARRTIMENGKPADQVTVLCGVARCSDPAVRAPAIAELERRLIAGAVPAELRVDAVRAVGAQNPSVDLVRCFLRQVADPAEDPHARVEMIGVLAEHPAQSAAVVDAMRELVKADPDSSVTPYRLFNAIAGARERKEADPEWAGPIAALAMEIVADPARSFSSRRAAISLCAFAGGAEASGKLEAIALTDKLPPELRAEAVTLLLHKQQKTNILASLAEQYDTLPLQFRQDLASRICRRDMGPGAEAFVIRFLKDDHGMIYRWGVLAELGLPLTPALLATLKELEQDWPVARTAKDTIQRLEKQAK